MVFVFGASGLGLRISDLGFRVPGSGFQMQAAYRGVGALDARDARLGHARAARRPHPASKLSDDSIFL